MARVSGGTCTGGRKNPQRTAADAEPGKGQVQLPLAPCQQIKPLVDGLLLKTVAVLTSTWIRG